MGNNTEKGLSKKGFSGHAGNFLYFVGKKFLRFFYALHDYLQSTIFFLLDSRFKIVCTRSYINPKSQKFMLPLS